MQVFVYEFVTGGGMWSLGQEPPHGSLLREGNAMLRAIVKDFAKLPATDVAILWDERLPSPPGGCTIRRIGSARQERAAIAELAASSDVVMVIAPELSGALLERVQWVEEVGSDLLSPGSEFVAIASDKHETCRRLSAAGVPTPHGVALEPGDSLPRDFPYPAVLKPRDGAGSQDVIWVAGADDPGATPLLQNRSKAGWRLEQFCRGLSASIAILCGPGGNVPLPACRQILSDDGQFRYLGGSFPLPPALNRRAVQLATAALEVLPPAKGYVGFDLVLGDDEDGSEDAVIEVNPRLTTSVVGLRNALQTNVVEALLQTARGIPSSVPNVIHPIDWSADGVVRLHRAKPQA